jgi:hypothetical protein
LTMPTAAELMSWRTTRRPRLHRDAERKPGPLTTAAHHNVSCGSGRLGTRHGLSFPQSSAAPSSGGGVALRGVRGSEPGWRRVARCDVQPLESASNLATSWVRHQGQAGTPQTGLPFGNERRHRHLTVNIRHDMCQPFSRRGRDRAGNDAHSSGRRSLRSTSHCPTADLQRRGGSLL